jgi:hypothetical protein
MERLNRLASGAVVVAGELAEKGVELDETPEPEIETVSDES